MAQAAKSGLRPVRVGVLTAGLLLAGVLLVDAAPQVKPAPPTTGRAAPPRRAVITLPRDASSDLVESVKSINEKLAQGWTENGITPSERQLGDAAGIVAVQSDGLDRAYLERWARELGVEDVLSALLAGRIRPKET